MATGNRTINRRFKDIDLDMIIHPHTNDVVGRYDDDALVGSILNIIKTRKGERVFQPDFGSTITDLIIDLDYLRRKELGGSTHPKIFFQLKLFKSLFFKPCSTILFAL